MGGACCAGRRQRALRERSEWSAKPIDGGTPPFHHPDHPRPAWRDGDGRPRLPRTRVGSLRVGEQDGFVVLGAIEDVQDVHGIGADVVENQVIAVGTAAHAGMFVAWH